MYHGWKNWETWNCSLWITSDENFYFMARDFMRSYSGRAPYVEFINYAGLTTEKTPDGAAWLGWKLDKRALNEMMREL